jgi:adenosine deaminase
MRLNNGIEALNGKFFDWVEILSNSDPLTEEYSNALSDLRTAMADILGLNEESLSLSFLKDAENLQLVQQYLEGSDEALEKLQANAAKNYLLHLDIDANSKM